MSEHEECVSENQRARPWVQWLAFVKASTFWPSRAA